MKRSLIILTLGLAGACIAHYTWFELRRPAEYSGSDKDIAWLKSELNLSGEQYARIRALHEQSSPRMLALAAQVSRMKEELDAFEKARLNEGQVDFLEFARFVEMRRSVDRECLASTRNLVKATAEVMTPQQRARYLNMIGQDPQAAALNN